MWVVTGASAEPFGFFATLGFLVVVKAGIPSLRASIPYSLIIARTLRASSHFMGILLSVPWVFHGNTPVVFDLDLK
jgi:hypothetical protein